MGCLVREFASAKNVGNGTPKRAIAEAPDPERRSERSESCTERSEQPVESKGGISERERTGRRGTEEATWGNFDTDLSRNLPPLFPPPLTLFNHVPHRCRCKHRTNAHQRIRADRVSAPCSHSSPIDFAGFTLDSLISFYPPLCTRTRLSTDSTLSQLPPSASLTSLDTACRSQDPRSSFRLGVYSFILHLARHVQRVT
jgi:hypothetical protein